MNRTYEPIPLAEWQLANPELFPEDEDEEETCPVCLGDGKVSDDCTCPTCGDVHESSEVECDECDGRGSFKAEGLAEYKKCRKDDLERWQRYILEIAGPAVELPEDRQV